MRRLERAGGCSDGSSRLRLERHPDIVQVLEVIFRAHSRCLWRHKVEPTGRSHGTRVTASDSYRAGISLGMSDVCELPVSLRPEVSCNGTQRRELAWRGDDAGKRCPRSPLRGAGLAQLAVQFFEFPYGCILALSGCLEEVRFGGHQRVRSHGSRS